MLFQTHKYHNFSSYRTITLCKILMHDNGEGNYKTLMTIQLCLPKACENLACYPPCTRNAL